MAVTLIYHADISYNCHSYAWYRTDNSNSIWIAPGDLGNGTYEEQDDMFIPSAATLIENNIRTTDIVVYYDHFGKILHSAVIVEIDGDNIVVQSKWGKWAYIDMRLILCLEGMWEMMVCSDTRFIDTICIPRGRQPTLDTP